MFRRNTFENFIQAIKDGDAQFVKKYINKELEKLNRGAKGDTSLLEVALAMAAHKGYTEIVTLLLRIRGLNVNRGIDKSSICTFFVGDTTIRDSNTALMYAASKRHTEIVRLLLNVNGINVDYTDLNGRDAEELARRACFYDVAELIHRFKENRNRQNNNLNLTSNNRSSDTVVSNGRQHSVENRANAGESTRRTITSMPDFAERLRRSTSSSYRPVETFSTTASTSVSQLTNSGVLTFEQRLANINVSDIAEDLIDPILQFGIINDPITVSSGITYDRSSLRDYFASKGNPRDLECPITRKPIFITELNNATNVLMKNLLEKFVKGKEEEKAKEVQQPTTSNSTHTQQQITLNTGELRTARLQFFDSQQRQRQPQQGTPVHQIRFLPC